MFFLAWKSDYSWEINMCICVSNCYKDPICVKSCYKENCKEFFLMGTEESAGHLCPERFRCNIINSFLALRVVMYWNRLHKAFMEPPSLEGYTNMCQGLCHGSAPFRESGISGRPSKPCPVSLLKGSLTPTLMWLLEEQASGFATLVLLCPWLTVAHPPQRELSLLSS